MTAVARILLLNPPIYDFAAFDMWARPAGLLYLGAALRQAGHLVDLVDCTWWRDPALLGLNRPGRLRARRQPDGSGKLPRFLDGFERPAELAEVKRLYSCYGMPPPLLERRLRGLPAPDVVLITSMMTYWYPAVRDAVACVRIVCPGSLVILGGIYATLCEAHAISNAGADEIVTGPGEERIREIVQRYIGNRMTPKLDPDNLDAYPYPAFDLQHKINYVALRTSKGCPFSCAYCASRFLNPKRMVRTPEAVVEEVRFWHNRFGVVDFVLYDDAFLTDAEVHAVPILEGLLNSGMKLRFHTPNALHIRSITPESARLMFKTGFTTLRLGLETTAFTERAGMDRKVTVEEFQSAVSNLKNAGYKGDQVGAYLLVGLPEQSMRMLRESIEIVKQSGITPVLAYYSPIPHTALWEKALAASRYDLAADPIFTNNAIMPCQKEPFSWDTLTRLKRMAHTKTHPCQAQSGKLGESERF